MAGPAQRAQMAQSSPPPKPPKPDAEPAEKSGADALSGYVPAPVSFVSPDDDEQSGYADGTQETPDWQDSGRSGAADKVFDVSAGRRRPVVFEEDDDLDVPDFLK